MANKKVLVFDLDDTLFYEIDYLVSAYKYIAVILEEKYSVSNVFSFMMQAYYDKKNVFEDVNRNYRLNIPVDSYLSLYRCHIPNIDLIPGTKEVLSVLSQTENVVLGLLTDGREVTQRNKITSLGLDKFIKKENIIISESFGKAKPSLENYLYFHKNEISDYIYVGDNVNKDFFAPNKLNWKTVCLLDKGKNIHKQNFSIASEYLPQYKISNINELLELMSLLHFE